MKQKCDTMCDKCHDKCHDKCDNRCDVSETKCDTADDTEHDVSFDTLVARLYEKTASAIDALDGTASETQKLRHLVQSLKDLREISREEDMQGDIGKLESIVREFVNL